MPLPMSDDERELNLVKGQLKTIWELVKDIKPPKNLYENPDFNPGDWAGGNYDDAYYMGEKEGEALLAEQIRGVYKIYEKS